MIGNSEAFRQAVRLVDRIGRHDVAVLIDGETGTGKELAARAIHYKGQRRNLPFVAINCGAIPDSLIENELFGHDSGAFTDARLARKGLVECADGGTLFLDEVDALSAKAQVLLLRFLQDQHYRPLGGGDDRQANVRVIAATNADLRALCAQQKFRLDLYYRLCVVQLTMPPLRERDGDAVLLARHFAGRVITEHRIEQRTIGESSMSWFGSYAWPGNVRELENLVCRAVLLADDEVVELVRPDSRGAGAEIVVAGGTGLDFARAKAVAMEQFERRYLETVLARARGNVTLAAQLAGKERRAMGKLMKKYALDRASYRPTP